MNNSDCSACKRSGGGRSCVVNGGGATKAGIMVVVGDPTYDDDKRGYYGSSSFGTLLRRILKKASVNEEDVFLTGATRCYTGKRPLKAELVKCRPYLVEEIERVQPKVIVTLGAEAYKSLTQNYMATIMKFRGSAQTLEEFGDTILLPTVALGSVWKSPMNEQLMVKDFIKARIAMEGWTEPLYTEAHIARSVADVYAIRDILLESEEFSFDCETTGLDYLSPPSAHHIGSKIICVSFSNEIGVGYTVPLFGEFCREIWTPVEYTEIIGIIYDILTSSIPKDATNGKFDVLYLWHTLGIPVQGFTYDDQLMYAHANEEKPHNLDYMRTIYTQMARYEGFKDDPKYKELLPYWGFACYPEEELWKYAAADADCEFRLAQYIRPLVIEESKGAGGLFAALRDRIAS